MDKEEIKAYLKKVDELGKKLVGQDKDTFDWMIFGYNQCAKILHEKEMIIDKAVEYINNYLERENFDYNILETNTIYNRDLFKVKKILQGDTND